MMTFTVRPAHPPRQHTLIVAPNHPLVFPMPSHAYLVTLATSRRHPPDLRHDFPIWSCRRDHPSSTLGAGEEMGTESARGGVSLPVTVIFGWRYGYDGADHLLPCRSTPSSPPSKGRTIRRIGRMFFTAGSGSHSTQSDLSKRFNNPTATINYDQSAYLYL